MSDNYLILFDKNISSCDELSKQPHVADATQLKLSGNPIQWGKHEPERR
jgi:hypothetical protein